jgi:hypothetical protein
MDELGSLLDPRKSLTRTGSYQHIIVIYGGWAGRGIVRNNWKRSVHAAP